MVIWRQPFCVFDVDVIGVALIVAIGAIGQFAVIEPWLATARAQQSTQVEVTRLDAAVRSARARLDAIKSKNETMRMCVSVRAAGTPSAASLGGFANQVSSLAAECGLSVEQATAVMPQDGQDLQTRDVQVKARGSVVEFAHFSDRMRRENQFHRITEYSIAPPAAGGDQCTITWTSRLHLMPDATAARLAAVQQPPAQQRAAPQSK